jgi:LacI family transcriptional regulator
MPTFVPLRAASLRARPTMVDVARRAGVSLKTVSRVVNAEPGVHARTLRTVQSAISALGFRRNDGASALRRGTSTRSLGLLLENVSDPFYSALTRAVEEVALRHDFLVFTGSSDEDAARERRLALAFCARRVDGLVIVPTPDDHGYLAPEVRAGTHVVFADRPGAGLTADAVLVDNAGGTRAAVEHLAGHGHKRIAFLGDDLRIYTAAERLRGYREALRRLGLRANEALISSGTPTEDSVRAALARFAAQRRPPTALVTGNNRTTILVLRFFAASPAARPALVGFDDFELSEALVPAVTVIAQDPAALGAAAADTLFSRLAGDRRPHRQVVLPVRLVARGSGELRP